MICQNKETNKKYNCSYQGNKMKLWNNIKKKFFITIEEFNSNYNIIDKWLKL